MLIKIFVILIILSLFIMTSLIVTGIVFTVKGLNNSKRILIAGMISGIVPLVLTTILLFIKK